MNDIEVTSIDLVEGGNVFKQGHYLTLGYVPRDEKGETVDLSGKTLNVSLWGRKGVVFEAAATYSGGVIRFTLDKMVPAGDYTVEFTVTSSTDAKYRKKFPTNQHSGRIAIKQSADDLGVVGIQVYTVAQLKAEQKALLDAAVSGFTVDSETKMARVSGTTTHPTIGARLEADKQATAARLADKAQKEEVRQDTATKPINVSEMDTETKQLFTGGAVAVVGENAVGSENVKPKAITTDKTNFITEKTEINQIKRITNEVTTLSALEAATQNTILRGHKQQGPNPIQVDDNFDLLKIFVKSGDVIRSKLFTRSEPDTSSVSVFYIQEYRTDGTVRRLDFSADSRVNTNGNEIRTNGFVVSALGKYIYINVRKNYYSAGNILHTNGKTAEVITINEPASLTEYNQQGKLEDYPSFGGDYYATDKPLIIDRYEKSLGDIQNVLSKLVEVS